ncbi:3-phosphoshikimate 1-carboxyvinyltransferase [Pectinatus cerevisiiphilus]|uniref:3-phosphoshikimate 1-carboxyvinyltransferase n=1 Tax=Pectinatus cerevisiiphilus TaxID=86956 RepID=A0A4R3KCX5_9FIRM|nr:3-phosphoshikimate 1-carboxyvinyltransferase [Pectinatus cerevisiiphilus]TCS80977.1 3-phosphoshikimate 1-carboxyvinyltransferase [Pectinatus cerevisiiphilus]
MAIKNIRAASAAGLHGHVVVPGDKSVSHRSVMFAGLCNTPVRITNFLRAQDCMSTVKCMQALGVKVEDKGDSLFVCGNGLHGLKEATRVIDAGNSGTTLRLMLGILAGQNFLTTFTGDPSLSSRPMGRVIKPLGKMGAKIVGRQGNSLLPITVIPAATALKGITYEMPMASAQVKSAILLAGLYAQGITKVIEPYPSRDHTERMLNAFGAKLVKEGNCVSIYPAENLEAPEYIEVPGDISSAAYFIVAASIIKGSDVLIKNVGMNETRTGIIDVLRNMGAAIEVSNMRKSSGEPVADLRVRYARLHGTEIKAEIVPRLIDEIPVITVAAMVADGITVISGAQELRVKESDRIKTICNELGKLTDALTEKEDGLIIKGGSIFKTAQCDSCNDHRIAMSLAVAGAAGKGVIVDHAECVDISYPEFYTTLEMLKNNSQGE